MKLTAGMEKFYKSGMCFLRIFFWWGRGMPGAEAEDMMLHVYNCFSVRLLEGTIF